MQVEGPCSSVPDEDSVADRRHYAEWRAETTLTVEDETPDELGRCAVIMSQHVTRLGGIPTWLPAAAV
jgi:hypothetical protein